MPSRRPAPSPAEIYSRYRSLRASLTPVGFITDPLGEARRGFPDYLDGHGRSEAGLSLDEFSMQMGFLKDLKANKLSTCLGLTFYQNAVRMVKFFGASMFGRLVEYPWGPGYDPERIRKHELSFCPPPGPEEPHSELLRTHNMARYGSGGLPEFVLKAMAEKRINSAIGLERRTRAYHFPKYVNEDKYFMETVRELKKRSVDFGKLTWCKVATIIQMCWRVSTTVDKTWGGWLLKVAVHAACTLERYQHGALEPSLAAMTLFQLSWEIAYGSLYMVLSDFIVCSERAAISAMLIEVARGFSSAGRCLLPTEHMDDENLYLFHRLAILSATDATAATSVIPESAWIQLARERIRSTNFCPSRQLSVNMKVHRHHMFHLIARADYLKTSRKLHSTCGDTCVKAYCTKNHQLAGHLDEGCQCPVRRFKPIETTDRVLLDTVNQELVVAEPGDRYVAVSQVWFQGIFGQSSRQCGECSLLYLKKACSSLGVRYAWVDTLCMPTIMDLRRKVITQLRDIYLDAAATLVVDVGLKSTKVRTALDLSLAILLSDWSSRIWTLQEGVLASKLLFCVGDQVLALPRTYGPQLLQDTRQIVPSALMEGYGQRNIGRDQRTLDSLLQLAAGRQTTYACDYLYGLSALLPSVPTIRDQDSNLLAIEVARMYQSRMGIDLTILQTSLDRCTTEGYRWMPLGANSVGNLSPTHVLGKANDEENGGLECPLKSLVNLTSAVDISKVVSPKDVQSVVRFRRNIKYWYSTEITGVFVGTGVKADHLIFCHVGEIQDLEDNGSFGFVVTQTMFSGRPAYEYIGEAVVIGKVPANPSTILVT